MLNQDSGTCKAYIQVCTKVHSILCMHAERWDTLSCSKGFSVHAPAHYTYIFLICTSNTYMYSNAGPSRTPGYDGDVHHFSSSPSNVQIEANEREMLFNCSALLAAGIANLRLLFVVLGAGSASFPDIPGSTRANVSEGTLDPAPSACTFSRRRCGLGMGQMSQSAAGSRKGSWSSLLCYVLS